MPAVSDTTRTLKVGHLRYKVVYVPDLKNNDREDLFGWVRYDRQEILLTKDMKPDREVEVMLHEIIHAALHENYPDHEESFVNQLGCGLAQIFIDNPWLVDHLKQKVRKINNG